MVRNPPSLMKKSARSPENTNLPYRPRSPFWTGVAIVLTSLIFAALHAAQWPAPIPLFLLAVGLGVVYQRTGSLLAPICHACGLQRLQHTDVVLRRAAGARQGEARGIGPCWNGSYRWKRHSRTIPDVDPGPQRGKT